jgi:hypothetical protein
MDLDTAVATGLYVYSFVHSRDFDAVEKAALKGLNDAPVTTIREGSLAILVSEISDRKIRPQRKFLAAHQHVVTEAARQWSALPVAFGLIADSEQHVRRLLQSNASILEAQLLRVENKLEMALSVEWTASNIFQYFMEHHLDLAASRDYVVAGNATREEQIELGRQFEQRLTAEREQYLNRVLTVLSPLCKEIDLQPLRREQEVVRIACLVNRDDVDGFEKLVYKAAEMFNDDFAFSYNGPWPPYSFVKLALSME